MAKPTTAAPGRPCGPRAYAINCARIAVSAPKPSCRACPCLLAVVCPSAGPGFAIRVRGKDEVDSCLSALTTERLMSTSTHRARSLTPRPLVAPLAAAELWHDMKTIS